MTRPVADLDGRADALCQVQDRRQVGGGPAVVPVPRRPGRDAIALVSSVRCCLARAETSAAANAAVSPARSATAASATARNASASRSPSASPRAPRRAGPHRHSSRVRPSRYPPPSTVSMIRGSAGSSSILRRKFFTCESTVRS
jgi:hypothetical protein